MNITHDLINSYVSDYDIFSFYIGSRFKLNKIFNSPLRKDSTPSFGIFQTSTGKLMYKDFGDSDSGDVIKFVRLKYNLRGFRDTLNQIYYDLIIQGQRAVKCLESPVNTLKTHSIDIGVKRKSFNNKDLEYWNQYNISKDILKLFEVSPIEFLFVGDYIKWVYEDENPMYVYKVYDKYKIYRPFADKKEKWHGNLTVNYIFGYKQLPAKGDLLIITKSLKDVMTLYSLGYSAISPPSEGALVPEKVINELKSRFTNIIVFYDNDEAGIKAAEKICNKYNLKSMIIPEKYTKKDISDFIKVNGTEKTSRLIYDLKDGLTEEKEERETWPTEEQAGQ